MTEESKNHPLVSVILTSYNYETFIQEAIDSVFNQTYRPMELIIVDDGSTDSSAEVIQEKVTDAPIPVTTIFQKNGGQANAWNNAYKKVNGEIVCFLDSDDYWKRIKVERMVTLVLDEPDGGIYQHQLENEAGEKKQRILNSGDYFKTWLEKGRLNLAIYQGLISPCVPSSGLVFRKEVLDQVFPIPEILKTCPDAFLTRTAPVFGPIHAYSGTLGYWREHGQNAGKQETYGYHEFWIPVIMPTLNEWYRENDIPIEFYCKKRNLVKEGMRHWVMDTGQFWKYFKPYLINPFRRK
ncbi:MAG: glycosyltransferase [Candidatus Omnitrophica bacterium]|nr:glycosyltransferase [Candidatus Omnitrophota bacterium]